MNIRFEVDPVSRLIVLTYHVPSACPETVAVRCAWRPAAESGGRWRPARVRPFLSETARRLAPADLWRAGIHGEVREKRAAGLDRVILFNPYPEAQHDGVVDIEFRIRIETLQGARLAAETVRIQADNSDVVYLHDWTRVLQKDAIGEEEATGRWIIRRNLPADAPPYAPGSVQLYGPGGRDLPLLTYPLDLRGYYAVFVYAFGRVRLRFSGEERYDRLGTDQPYHEQLWQWCRLDRQHLIIRQNHAFTGPAPTALGYVKLVPLTPALVKGLENRFGNPDRFVAAYWEPYSYAFSDDVRDVFWHRQYLTAYRDARVSLVDTQLGRFGARMVFETRTAEQLWYQTIGDPIGAVRQPRTSNVGRMQQYTNTLENTLRFCSELGLTIHANFGAGNCYPGTPLQGRFSREHPEWVRGAALRYEVPEVRKFVLSVYREALDIGARGLSIDFCRYPEALDTKETGNTFLRELRALADEYSGEGAGRIPILVRFPARGVRRWECFDYETWLREGLVDFLCPSNIQGRFHYFDPRPYIEAVKRAGNRCVLLPVLDALPWGLPAPGLFLQRAAQLYDHGVPGIYVYQADAFVVASPADRRYMRMLRSTTALHRFLAEEARLRPQRSKGVFISKPTHPPAYHPWERIHVWLEGIEPAELDVFLDGEHIQHFTHPPYLIGDQGAAGDQTIPPGKHELRIRARDGAGWIEETFHIQAAR